MGCNCKHYRQEIKYGKRIIGELKALFIDRMTVDSPHNDRRRKDFNQAIFCKYIEDGEHEQVFCGTTMEMVLQCFDDAAKDWERSFCELEKYTLEE